MKREVDGMPRLLLATYRILIVTVLILVSLIAGGTIVALTARGAAPHGPERAQSRETASDTSPRRTGTGLARKEAYFTGVGRIRAATADPRPATVIVSIAFPYDKSDGAFSEELAARTRDFRELAVDLFSSYTAERLRKTDEAALKAELLGKYNAILRLGRIDTVYFNDYLVVE
jgi:flagellar basal body-associated protein FliL